MKLGLHISSFDFDSGPAGLADDLRRIATTAEDVGFTRISVMDHVFQISHLGPPEAPMLEAYTALGYLAACTRSAELLAWVTAVTYRDPGLLAKAATTLDVLSGGRAILGIGAGWNTEEAEGLGLFLPPLSERFERLEEALQIVQQMWSSSDESYEGRHYHLARTLNSPAALRQPHPPILIGGGGERKTLRLVAQYAQLCNLFAAPDLAHKLEVLQQRCAEVGRPYDEIEKTIMWRMPAEPDWAAVLDEFASYRELGVQQIHFGVPGADRPGRLEEIGRRLIGPAAAL